MPFEPRLRFELVNESGTRQILYYQIDYTLDVARDADATASPHGPGRFLGCVVGIRVLQDELSAWYGEGEVKIHLDGDTTSPTICGTGLEGYVGTAWAMGAPAMPFAGVPFELRDPARADRPMPDLTGFYRWHVPDPIVFRESLRVTIQQIGAVFVLSGEEAKRAAIDTRHPVAGTGWRRSSGTFAAARAIAERCDDYCAAAFVFCREPQAVQHYLPEEATAEIARLPYEQASPTEGALDFVGANAADQPPTGS